MNISQWLAECARFLRLLNLFPGIILFLYCLHIKLLWRSSKPEALILSSSFVSKASNLVSYLDDIIFFYIDYRYWTMSKLGQQTDNVFRGYIDTNSKSKMLLKHKTKQIGIYSMFYSVGHEFFIDFDVCHDMTNIMSGNFEKNISKSRPIKKNRK